MVVVDVHRYQRDECIQQQVVDLDRKTFEYAPFAQEYYDELFTDDQYSVLVAVTEEKHVVGHTMLRVTDRHMISLAVADEYRGQGIGRALVLASLHQLRGGMWLQVRVDNPTAIALYQKCGLRVIATAPRYYRDGTAAFIMSTHNLYITQQWWRSIQD